MSQPTRTIGPLHLEDLEPHRFEDLVRQLLYDFRPWRQLEATGRAGSDDGFDARGWEIVPGEPATTAAAAENTDEDDETTPASAENDRLWLIQCKREKKIGPTKLVSYLDDIPAVERGGIYGVALAAACDFSKQARDVFRQKAREMGFAEVHLWGKAEIEDMLFQPKNDYLLFAYFGISLQIRRRTLKTELRGKLAIKRKAMRVLKPPTEILVRDAADDRYPRLDANESLRRYDRGRWKVRRYVGCFHDGLRFVAHRHFAFIDDDGEHWDFVEQIDDAPLRRYQDPWSEEQEDDDNYKLRGQVFDFWDKLPQHNKAWLEHYLVLPYENVLDIDEHGDEFFKAPHIFTIQGTPEYGPFNQRGYRRVEGIGFDRRRCWPRPETRVEKFPHQWPNAPETKEGQ